MNSTKNTQLTSAIGYNTNNMIFSEPIVGTIGNTAVPITFRRIMISTKNPDGTIGDLILPVSGFSYGVSENKDPNTGKLNGYVFPICLYTRNATTEEEKEWVESFENIVDKCKDHLVENRAEIEQYDLEKRDLKKLNPIYYKRINGQIDPSASPTFYVKLMVKFDKETGERKIISMFYDHEDNELNPLELIGKRCNSTAALKVESIFIGNKISLQVKLYEANVKVIETGMKRLLSSTPVRRKLINQVPVSNTISTPEEIKEDDDEDSGSIVDSDNESIKELEPEPEPEPEKPKKKRVKKVVRKKKKKT